MLVREVLSLHPEKRNILISEHKGMLRILTCLAKFPPVYCNYLILLNLSDSSPAACSSYFPLFHDLNQAPVSPSTVDMTKAPVSPSTMETIRPLYFPSDSWMEHCCLIHLALWMSSGPYSSLSVDGTRMPFSP